MYEQDIQLVQKFNMGSKRFEFENFSSCGAVNEFSCQRLNKTA